MVDCLSCQSCCGSLRSSKLYPKEKRPISRKRAAQKLYLQKQIQNSNTEKSTFSCDSLSCVSSNVQSKTKRRDVNNNKNTNNNNNVSTSMADEEDHLLEFYIFDISHERNLNLTIDSNDKRLISFYDISNGLHTIGIRNGYICAEWEWGGLPSWLLQDNHMRVRSTYPNFLHALKNYYSELLPILSEHQYNRHGQGSIIAFQIENEYGGYDEDKNYLEAIRAMYNEFGLNELFFTSDNRFDLAKGALDDVWATVNFQRNIKENMDKLVEFRPKHHMMISEYWTGWFDYWGGKHQTGQRDAYDAKEFENDLQEILLNSKYEISINFYMFFGGTNFGFTSGGHHFPTDKYSPLVTSYDYDAPLSEAGDPTDKYFAIQNVINKFYEQNPKLIIYNHERSVDDQFQVVRPSISKKVTLGTINIFGCKTFEQILNDDILTKKYSIQDGPLNMEQFQVQNQTVGVSQGFIVYKNDKIENLLNDNEEHFIVIPAIADNAIVLANEKVIFKSLHTDNSIRFNIPSGTSTLTIIVENMGRINYGPTLDHSRKGILDKVLFDNKIELKQWTVNVLEFRQGMSSITDWYKLEIDEKDTRTIYDLTNGPQLFYAPFNIENESSIHDTYLSLNGQWTKGVAFINGFNLGRYWSIGPQLTLYIPKELLFKGFNQLQLFELYTYGKSIEFVDTPVINA